MLKVALRIILPCLTFLVIGSFVAGNPFVVPLLVVFMLGRMGSLIYYLFILCGLVIGNLAAKWVPQPVLRVPGARAALVVAAVMLSITLMITVYAELRRSYEIAQFAPDEEYRASIFQSFRKAPADSQFFLHGAALKNCTPYAWSWHSMGYYPLSAKVAPNVLPGAWLKKCQITRESLGLGEVVGNAQQP